MHLFIIISKLKFYQITFKKLGNRGQPDRLWVDQRSDCSMSIMLKSVKSESTSSIKLLFEKGKKSFTNCMKEQPVLLSLSAKSKVVAAAAAARKSFNGNIFESKCTI